MEIVSRTSGILCASQKAGIASFAWKHGVSMPISWGSRCRIAEASGNDLHPKSVLKSLGIKFGKCTRFSSYCRGGLLSGGAVVILDRQRIFQHCCRLVRPC
jgi:hypothetical protein